MNEKQKLEGIIAELHSQANFHKSEARRHISLIEEAAHLMDIVTAVMKKREECK